MISVKILRNSASRIVGFEVSGHANYAEYGQDIVCAAVSAFCVLPSQTAWNDIFLLA